MATSQYSTTSETTNAGRASRVLLGPCSAQLRDLLRDHVPPQKFPQIIRQKMANHKWTKPQRDLILPSTGQYSGNYSDFDISLLYTLLRNLCNIPKHKNGWGNDPDPNDMSLAAYIERIRICRNRLGHALDFSLSDLEFNDIWSSISTAVIEIDKVLKSNHKHEKDVDFLRYEPMDFEMANYFEETLRKQYEEDLEIKSLLSKHIKCSDEKLDDMKSLIAKEFECTKAMIHDQQRRNTSIGDTYTAQYNTNSVQPTNQFLGFLRWILTVFGIMRILNFFWNTEELVELEAKEISYSSVLLQWENTINQRDNSEVLYLIEYGITRTNHAEEKIRVNSCAYRLENLKHSTEYEVQVKAVSPSGEKQHSKKIKFKTEALEKLEYTEITEASILLKWEPKKHTRGEDSVAFIVEYETTQPDIKIERVEVKSCEYRLEKLRHSTEYRVQIKVKTDSGETEHTDKIIFETRRHAARGLSETEIQTFERDLKKSKVRLKNVRLMAIGHQGVGKTTLLHRLRNLDSNPSEAELSTISPTKSIKTDLNYAVCNKRGDIICLGEDDICRRKLGMSLEEKDDICRLGMSLEDKDDICRRKLGMSLEENDDICRLGMSLEDKEQQTPQKKEVKSSNAYEDVSIHGGTSFNPAKDTKSYTYEDVPIHGGTSSNPAEDTKSEKTIEKQISNEDTATKIDTDSSLVEDVGLSTDTVKSHSSVITDENTGQTPSEIASQSTHANESEESEKKKSVIGDELAQDLGKILKEAQVGTDDEFFISYWDFAGEDAYHDTHVAFMSSDAVYLLLFNAAELVQEANGESKRSQEEHLRFWLQNIASLRSENISTPPVIVIGTHMDELDEKSVPGIGTKVEDIVRQLAKDQGALENLYKIYLKNLKRDGITDIWEGIKRAKEKQEHWNKEVPSKMQILEYILTLEKKKTNSSYSSSTQDIQASWNKIGDTSEVDDDLNLYLKMLSDSGSILFLEHDNNVVLDISWIIKCFANIFAPSKEISEATKCHLKEPRIREDVFTEFILHDEKGENITLKSFLSLGLIVKSNEYITVPAYLPENRDDLASMREMITKNKKTQEKEISSKLSIFFERKNAAKVNIPLSTLFFNSILIVLIDSLQRKGGGKTLSPAQKSTCLTSIGKTSGILDDNQVHGLIYEMKEGTLHLLAYSLERDSLPTNLLQDIISKINKLNNAYHKKPLEMKFEISEGYTVPFKSEKAKKWMEYWTSKCSDCGEWKDIAYQTGQDISFIDDEGWLKGHEDLADVVFKCMKCFKSDDNENREITSHGSNDRRGTGSRSQHLVLSERFLGDLASQIGADWQLLFIRLGLTNTELEHIDYDRGFNQVTKNLKAFLLWRKKNKDRQASEQLRILFEGFQESGRQDLVDKYTEYLDDVILISAYESSDHKAKFGEFKTDSAARKDKTETDIQRHDAEILYIRKQIDDDKSVTASIEDQQARLEQLEITNRTRQDKIKADIQRHDTVIVNLRQQMEIKQSVTDVEPDVNIFREKLIERNNEVTRQIPLSPVATDGDTLPIEHLFSSVVIREDVTENRKGKKSAQSEEQQERKEVKSPEDMLTKNGKPVPRVFMLGKAAHGKTTYCKWFLKTWCNTQQPCMSGRPLNKWENALSQFDFVFHVPLYQVDQSRADVIDMICQDILGSDTVLRTTAKHVLSSDKYRCFIMIDGLDEWKPDQSVIDRLKYKGMPNIDNMSNCVIFTTMRPWKFSEVMGVQNEDRVIEILGLDDAGIESVIEKMLVHYFKMKPGTAEFEAKCKEIKSKLDNETVKSFIKIPLLAVVCVQIWYDGQQVEDSMTSFYIAMVNMLIKRAHLKHDTQKLSFESINVSLPKLLFTKRNIKNYIKVLLKLGKVAYEGLLSKEMKLVFQRDDLETEIGERELQFALDVGLISQRDVHSVKEKKVSVHFFNISVQEFLAAIYIVTNKEVSDSFCKHLCDIKVIMELSSVIMFICGMCPYLGSVISQCVVSVTDTETEICKYRRESPDGRNNTVEELYKLQISWHRELEYGQTDIPVTDSPVTFHIADVYLWDSDLETVRVTRELLSYHQLDVRSLYLFRVATDGERGITDTIVNDLLSNQHQTRSLTMIHIDGQNTARSVDTIIGPSLRTLDLSHVQIADTNTVPRPILCDCKLLQKLCLEGIILGDRDIGLAPNMTMLQEVRLREVNMTSSGWGTWLQSVIDIHHQFDVELYDTNIDRHTVSTIHSSPHLSVTQDGLKLMFTRVWPPT